ncbi:MAG: hypothetical protein OEM85_18250 [Gammaproteobacteria bacterium]|nr:hypothetical protein [Gammaproteobacteria bacterium]
MEEVTFLVKGSSPEPYEVIFLKDGDKLTAICNCPAGQYSNFCKHRISILDGKFDAIASDNADQAPQVVAWLVGTDVEAALAELRAAQREPGPDKKALIAAKRKLARAMNS